MTAFVWDGTANLWASNHWGRGGVAPVYPGDAGSAVADTIVIDATAADFPTSAPAAGLVVAAYTCLGGAFDCGAFLNVTGALTMGTVAGIDAPIFSGIAVDGCVVLFQGASINGGSGEIGDNATFSDSAVNDGLVLDYATFNLAAHNNNTVGDYATFNNAAVSAATVGDYATFNGTAYSGTALGVVGNYATYNDAAYNNTATVGNNATFNDTAYNNAGATVGNYATFNDSAYNVFGGTVDHYATFNNAAYNAGEVGGYATFNGTSQNYAGSEVGDNATFNSPANQDGLYTGTTYTVSVAVTFNPTAAFTGAAPIVFTLTTSTASVTGAFTTDGGATPTGVTVNLSPAASLGPFPVGAIAIGPYPITQAPDGSVAVGPYPVT